MVFGRGRGEEGGGRREEEGGGRRVVEWIDGWMDG